MNLSRRRFVVGAAAVAAGGCATMPKNEVDPNLSVFISDLHVRAGESYQKDHLAKVVDAILAMRPPPKNVVCFGDIAYHCGLPEEYRTSRSILQPLVDAGITLTFGMGNHDRRSAFLDAWPEYRARNLLDGHIVSRVDLGACDLLMLDGLQGTDDRARNDMGPVSGAMSRRHQEWLVEALKQLKRPAFIASHYTYGDTYAKGEMDVLGEPLMKTLLKCPLAVGYVYGHAHRWTKGWHHEGWGKDARELRTLCLPSTGHWGDIGYVVFRTSPGRAVAELYQNDYFFPSPPGPGKGSPDARSPVWDRIVAENRGQTMHWMWNNG